MELSKNMMIKIIVESPNICKQENSKKIQEQMTKIKKEIRLYFKQ